MRGLSKRNKILLMIVLMVAVLLFVAFYYGLTVTRHTIYSGEIGAEVTVVLLTDLHSHRHGEAQSKLIEKIDMQNPDIILMSGDIFDDALPDDGAIELVEGIVGRYPCFYVTGNHELWSRRSDEMKDTLRSRGVAVLEGECADITVSGQEILILGVDDPDVGARIFDKQFADVTGEIRSENFTILLSHRPELFERYTEYDFDLVLSGHAHGGQWRLPLLLSNGLLAPNQGLFPRYTKGLHEDNGTKMIVSRGLSRNTVGIPRIFNPPELVVINLRPLN